MGLGFRVQGLELRDTECKLSFGDWDLRFRVLLVWVDVRTLTLLRE